MKDLLSTSYNEYLLLYLLVSTIQYPKSQHVTVFTNSTTSFSLILLLFPFSTHVLTFITLRFKWPNRCCIHTNSHLNSPCNVSCICSVGSQCSIWRYSLNSRISDLQYIKCIIIIYYYCSSSSYYYYKLCNSLIIICNSILVFLFRL